MMNIPIQWGRGFAGSLADDAGVETDGRIQKKRNEARRRREKKKKKKKRSETEKRKKAMREGGEVKIKRWWTR